MNFYLKTFLDVISVTIPIFSIIAIGYLFRRKGVIRETAVPALNKVAYYLGLTTLVFTSIVKYDLKEIFNTGIVFSFIFIPKLSPINISNETFNTLSVSITEGFNSIATAMQNASIATTDISESVNNAKDSLETASKVTDETSKAFKEMSKLVDFDILGLKPFETVYVYFKSGSESLSQLSKDLLNTGKSLYMNSSDIMQLGSDLAEISVKMTNLSVSFNKTTNFISFDQFGKILNYLKIYIAVLHAMFILIGFSIMFLNAKQDNSK